MAGTPFKLCSLLVCSIFIIAFAQGPISYQVHSWDDLREWPQMFRKGVRWTKIDPHYMPSSFCASQTSGTPDPRGCLVLNHDTPVSTRIYNTTDEVLSILADPSYKAVFSQTEPFYIALCFKCDDFNPCDLSTSAANWLSLVDDLFANATSVVSQHGLNVQFILDGSGTPGGSPTQKCLNDRYRPWPATYITDQDPPEAFLFDNASLGYDRFQILDDPDVNLMWDLVAKLNYGKFSSKPFPYLIWEPADQSNILSICEIYNKHTPHPQGLRFAINIDPAMFQVYSSSQSGIGWNTNISAVGTRPHHAVMQLSTAPANQRTVVTFASSSSSGTEYTLSNFTGVMGPLSVPTAAVGRIVAASAVLGNVSAVHSLVPDVVLVSDTVGNLVLYTAENGDLVYVSGHQLTPSALSATAAVLGDAGQTFVLQVYTSDSCVLNAQLWQVTSNSADMIGDATCVDRSGSPPVFMSAAASYDNSGAELCGFPDAIQVVVVYSDSSAKVWSSVFCVAAQSGKLSDIVLPVVYGVGTSPSVSMLHVNNITFVAAAQGDSYCFNSETHNKEPTPAMCDAVPVSTANVLSYMMAPLSKWVATLSSGQMFSACDGDFSAAAYDQGSAPSIALYEINGTVGIAEIHEGFPVGAKDVGNCGAPNYRDGLVADAWDVAPFVSSWL